MSYDFIKLAFNYIFQNNKPKHIFSRDLHCPVQKFPHFKSALCYSHGLLFKSISSYRTNRDSCYRIFSWNLCHFVGVVIQWRNNRGKKWD